MYSSVSSPLSLAKSLFFPMILKPHFCSTRIDPMLSVAALAKIGRSISFTPSDCQSLVTDYNHRAQPIRAYPNPSKGILVTRSAQSRIDPCGQQAAYNRRDDRHPRVTPIAVPLARHRQ